MFIKWLTRGKYGLIGLLMSMVALPAWAGQIIIPPYIDNSKCLLNQTSLCDVETFYGELDYRISLNYKGFQVTNGKVFVFFNPTGNYVTALQQQQYIPGPNTFWAPMQGTGYLFRVGPKDGHGQGTTVPVLGFLDVQDNNGNFRNDIKCQGELGLSNSYYRNYLDKTKGIVCPLEDGWFPVAVTLKSGIGGNIPIHIVTRDPKRTRKLPMPMAQVRIEVEGRYHDGSQPSGDTNYQVKNLFNRPEILLNDRLCKISTPNTQIDFGNVSTTAPAGKIAERVMPLTVICAGVPQPQDCPGCRPDDAWKGVDSNLVGININTTLTYPGADATKKIGLAPAHMPPEDQAKNVRKDLFVEGTWSPNERCGVKSLWTNGTKNEIKPMYLPVGQSASAPLPTLYWRLCVQPTDGRIQPGRFNGQAMISVEYN